VRSAYCDTWRRDDVGWLAVGHVHELWLNSMSLA